MHARADGGAGLGYTYASPAAADVIAHTITPIILSRDAMDIEAAYVAMRRAVRNAGVRALRATAISAVDIALWDLKAHLLGMSQRQLGDWVAGGIRAVKMKVGRNADADRTRVALARDAIGSETPLASPRDLSVIPSRRFRYAMMPFRTA